MIREIQGKIQKIPARFDDSNEIPGAVNVIPNRVGPLSLGLDGQGPGQLESLDICNVLTRSAVSTELQTD